MESGEEAAGTRGTRATGLGQSSGQLGGIEATLSAYEHPFVVLYVVAGV